MSLRDPTKAKDCHWEDFKAVLPEKKKKKKNWEAFKVFGTI